MDTELSRVYRSEVEWSEVEWSEVEWSGWGATQYLTN